MLLKCCKCGDKTDWKDTKRWNKNEDFYCPDCSEMKVLEKVLLEIPCVKCRELMKLHKWDREIMKYICPRDMAIEPVYDSSNPLGL